MLPRFQPECNRAQPLCSRAAAGRTEPLAIDRTRRSRQRRRDEGAPHSTVSTARVPGRGRGGGRPGSHRRTDEPHPPERQRSLRSAAEPERAGEPDAAERRGALRYRSTLLDGEYVTGAAGVSRPDRRARRERVRLGFGRRRRVWRTGTRARGCSGGSRPPGSASRQHSPGRLMSNSAVGSDRRRERTRPPVRRRLKEETDKAYTKVLWRATPLPSWTTEEMR